MPFCPNRKTASILYDCRILGVRKLTHSEFLLHPGVAVCSQFFASPTPQRVLIFTMVTPLQALSSFASRLGSVRSAGGEEAPLVSSLSSLLSLNLAGSNSTCSFPSLWLGPMHSLGHGSQSHADEVYSSGWMAESIKVNEKNIGSMPETMLRNVTTSFGTLVDETRDKYLRDAIDEPASPYYPSSGAEKTLRSQAIHALANSHPISFTLAMTKINTAPFSRGSLEASNGDVRAVVLPLTFIVKIEVLILGWRRVTILLNTAGVIRGSYKLWDPSKFLDVSLELDTAALYLAMRSQSISLMKTAHRASMVLVSKQRKLIAMTTTKEAIEKEQTTTTKLKEAIKKEPTTKPPSKSLIMQDYATKPGTSPKFAVAVVPARKTAKDCVSFTTRAA